MAWAAQHWHGRPRSAKWANKSRANDAITSRACRATPKSLEARSGAIGGSKMVSIGYSTSHAQEDASRMRHPITASRMLWCCGTWPSICSNRNARPNVASKLGDSKPDGAKITFAESLPLKNLDAIALPFYRFLPHYCVNSSKSSISWRMISKLARQKSTERMFMPNCWARVAASARPVRESNSS